MSSVYRILCLSHDPAIVSSIGEYPEEWRDPAPALAAVAERSGPAAQHRDCDLLVGRYSYPLVEVCCPRTTPSGRFHSGYHPHEDKWIDAGWLRLLALADGAAIAAAGRTDCWSMATAKRLRYELGLEDTDRG